MTIVRDWCTRAIRLDAGRIIADGTVREVLGEEPPEKPRTRYNAR
jgi:ABC-type polysaccharide/polyol phosphate transport system ATPase subunit